MKEVLGPPPRSRAGTLRRFGERRTRRRAGPTEGGFRPKWKGMREAEPEFDGIFSRTQRQLKQLKCGSSAARSFLGARTG